MLKATTAASVSLDSLSQRMSAGNFLVFAVFQLFHFLHVFLLGHTLTGSKFLLLFSIKSKEEILCFAAKVPNERTPHVCQAIFLRFCALFFSRTCAVPLIKKPPYLSVWRFFLSEIPIPYLSLSCAPSSSAKPFKILSIASAISASANVFSALRKVMEYATDL